MVEKINNWQDFDYAASEVLEIGDNPTRDKYISLVVGFVIEQSLANNVEYVRDFETVNGNENERSKVVEQKIKTDPNSDYVAYVRAIDKSIVYRGYGAIAAVRVFKKDNLVEDDIKNIGEEDLVMVTGFNDKQKPVILETFYLDECDDNQLARLKILLENKLPNEKSEDVYNFGLIGVETVERKPLD